MVSGKILSKEKGMDLSKLQDKFIPADIEWRLSRAGEKNGTPWAFVLAYVTNRAIMERLDEVCGPENWKNIFDKAPDGGVLCGIGIKCGDEWVFKYDGAENTNIESVKGGLSGAMKRAGVQWGIGRYLYDLPGMMAVISPNGKYYAPESRDKQGNVKYKAFKWDEPSLPLWALPVKNLTPEEQAFEDKMSEIVSTLKKAALTKEKRAEYGTEYNAITTIEQADNFMKKIKKDLAVAGLVKLATGNDVPADFEDDDIPIM
jgi:hypothetical protein